MAKPVVLQTERLTLRAARMDDLDDLFAVMSHPEGMAYWSTPPHESVAVTRPWLTGMVENEQAGPLVDFMLEYEGRAVGTAGCFKLPEIGYNLRRDLWGRGLASEALGAIIPHVFASHPVDALTADVDPRNARSLRLLERLGFERTGFARDTFCVAGEWVDSIYLTLRRAT